MHVHVAAGAIRLARVQLQTQRKVRFAIGAEVARRPQQAERDRIDTRDDHRALIASSPGQDRHVLDVSEEVRVLEGDADRVLVDRGRQMGGARVGTFCIIDVEPRQPGPDDLELLRDRALELVSAGTSVEEPSQRRRFATQMLASMENNPKPTRAEASDVANAILDGTSAVMLSGETAVGKYPLQALETLATIALHAEASLNDYGYLQKIKPSPANVVTQAIGQASVSMAKNLGAAGIISLTESGFTSRLVSKYRPDCPIMAITSSERVARKLSMNWGVIPALYQGEPNDDARIEFAISRIKQLANADSGDILVVTAGHLQHGAGSTDLVRIITL